MHVPDFAGAIPRAFTPDPESLMTTTKETAQKNATEITRALRGQPISQTAGRMLEAAMGPDFAGATSSEPSVTGMVATWDEAKPGSDRTVVVERNGEGEITSPKAPKTIEGTATRVERTDEAPPAARFPLGGKSQDEQCTNCGAELAKHKRNGATCPPVTPEVYNSRPVKPGVKPPSKFAAEVAAAMNPGGEEAAELARAAMVDFSAPMPPTLERIEVSVSMLEESPSNPRKTFTGLKALGENMVKLGCLQAIIIRPLASGYQVVAGHRRVRAAKEAGILTLPADVRNLTDSQVMKVQLAENVQRADLSPLEQAEGLEWLHKTVGLKVEQVASLLGLSMGTVYSRMKLLDLSATCRKALADGKIPMSVAAPLARCGRTVDQDKALKAILARAAANSDEVNARAEVEWLQKEFTRAMKSPPFDPKDAMLLEGTEACTTCPKRTTNMPRELFDQRPADTCTDVSCFVGKCRATFEAAAADAKKKGARIMSVEEGAALFRFDTLGPDSNLVELDAPNTADPKRRPWRELLSKLPDEKRPQVVVAPDRSFAAHQLVDRKELVKALAEETGAKWAVEASTSKRKSKEEREEAREEKHEARAREAAALTAVTKIAQAAAKGLNAAEWLVLFETVAGASSFRAEVFAALGVENFAQLDKRMKKAQVPELITATLVLALVDGGHTDAEDGYTDEIKALSKARGIDLAAIEKACAVMPGGEVKPPKGKKK